MSPVRQIKRALVGEAAIREPLRPGNAGEGKDPDFWRAFEEAEDR